jgi:hypothetical protein
VAARFRGRHEPCHHARCQHVDVLRAGVADPQPDASSFLPFFVRIWMYLSPILWAPEHVIGRFSGPIMTLIQLNPMYAMIGGYTELLQNDRSQPRTCGYPLRCGRWWLR